MNRVIGGVVAACLAAGGSVALGFSAPVAAAEPLVIIVDNGAPGAGDCSLDATDGACTLQTAIDIANGHPGSTIRLSALTYVVASTQTIRADGTTIVGAAAQTSTRSTDHMITVGARQGFVVDADDVTIRGVTITGASNANGKGGAIDVRRNADGFVLANSSIAGNHAREGGGLNVDGSGRVERSTFVSNSAGQKGGGIRVAGALDVVNSTFTENVAQSGGAISVAGVSAISASTFLDNTSNNKKGGGVDRNGGSVYVTGSILTVARQQGDEGSDCSGNPDLIGPNFVGNALGCQPGPETLVGTVDGAADLGTLGAYGGPTDTIPLADESIAVNRSGPDTCREIGRDGVLDTSDPVIPHDQRGIARADGLCDLGAFEVTDLQITGIDLTSFSPDTNNSSEVLVGAQFLPSSAISQSVLATDDLFQGSLKASPLDAFPLESTPLDAFPLDAFPLDAFPLDAFPLDAFFLAAAPLDAFPLDAFPLDAFPLDAFPLSELVLRNASWDTLLDGTDFEGVPLQSLTLGDVRTVPAVRGVDIAALNLEGTPLDAFPLTALLLSGIPLDAFPLDAFGTSISSWCDLVPDFCFQTGTSEYEVDPTDDRYSLASLALAGVPLDAFPLDAFPLDAFPLDAFPLDAFPLDAFPLDAFQWQASPLDAFPLDAFPLDAFSAVDFSAVINCAELPGGTCAGATLGDVAAAGAFVGGATLSMLGDLITMYPSAFQALGEYTLADLIAGLLPPESIPWNEIDFTIPGLQNAGDPDQWTFQYITSLTLTAPAAQVSVEVEIPAGFSYVPGGARLDGAPVAEPTLSCPDGSCYDLAGERTPTTLTFALTDVPAGTVELEIDTRAGFELGTFTATANATATNNPSIDPVTAGPATHDVAVIAPDQAVDVPILIETASTCTSDGSGDLNLGWVAGSTDGIDLYKFDISKAAAACGIRADIFLSNLAVDLDLVLYAERQTPLRGAPDESITYLDDVILDLNPFDDVVQADTVQDIRQVLAAQGVDAADYAVAAISSNRADNGERIQTGTLREGTYYLQVTGYNGAVANSPYALRLRTNATVPREPCAAIRYPTDATSMTLPGVVDTPSDLNTLFIVNHALLEETYGETAAADIIAEATEVAGRADLGVIGAVLAVDADPAVRLAYEARASDPCNPARSNDVVREIGKVIDRYTTGETARPVENIVIVGDDSQVPMANIVDNASFANERTFVQEFAGEPNNPSIAALAAGMYRSDDPYGTEAGIQVRDHELFVPERAVGRLVETPTDIIGQLQNFITYSGRLDPGTERNALQTGYEFLTDGADLNADNLRAAAYTVDDTLIDDTWVDTDLITKLGTPYDVIGIHAHFDEANALPAFDNFNLPVVQDDLFNVDELPDAVDRSVVYSMGCHSGYSLSDVQIGTAGPDWAQALATGRTTTFAGNTGYGYGDSDRIALSEQLTANFAAEVGQDGSVGQAWTDAKQRMVGELSVLDAYQEKVLQQFVFYGLPMFHVGAPPPDLSTPSATSATLLAATTGAPDTDPITGQPIETVEVRRNLPNEATDDVLEFELVEVSGDGAYYQIDGRALTVNGHPIQPLYVEEVPSYDGLRARDGLITELTTIDADDSFDPVFFWPSPNFGGPRPEYTDGSFPAEMATVRSTVQGGEKTEQVLIAGGQYRASDVVPDSGLQRLHTRVVTQVYYSSSNDFVPPAILRSTGFADEDAIQFDIEVDAAERVYVLYRASGENVWSGVDLVKRLDGSWTGVGPFTPELGQAPEAEYIVQAVDGAGNVAISNEKSRYFLTSTPGQVSNLTLTAEGSFKDGWYSGDTTVTAANGDQGRIDIRLDAGEFTNYVAPLVLSDDPETAGTLVDTGQHVVTAFDVTGAFAALVVQIDSIGPTTTITRNPPDEWFNGDVQITIAADDGDGSGVDTIEYRIDDGPWTPYGVPFSRSESAKVSARSTDIAGNVSDETTSLVQIDTKAPTVTITAAPADTTVTPNPVNSWWRTPVIVTVAPADDVDGSGIDPDTIEYSIGDVYLPYTEPFTLDVDGEYTVTAQAKDVAGNTGTAEGSDAVTVRVDKTPPVVPTLTVAPTVLVGGSLTATFNCGDATSGIASCVLSVGDNVLFSDPNGGSDVPLPTVTIGEVTVIVTAVDFAGNRTSRSATYTVVDDTPPEVTLTVEFPNAQFGSANTATFSCADPDSGITACELTVTDSTGAAISAHLGAGTVPLPTDTLGTFDVTVVATNGAGVTSTARASYSVELCVVESYDFTQEKQIGSNYTIKIQLCDGQGNNISSKQTVLTAVSITDSFGNSREPGPNDSGGANDGFEFRFSQKQYIYNLDTTNFPFAPGTFTLDFTTEPVPDRNDPPAPQGRARFSLRM